MHKRLPIYVDDKGNIALNILVFGENMEEKNNSYFLGLDEVFMLQESSSAAQAARINASTALCDFAKVVHLGSALSLYLHQFYLPLQRNY